jgi:hypothetical protein
MSTDGPATTVNLHNIFSNLSVGLIGIAMGLQAGRHTFDYQHGKSFLYNAESGPPLKLTQPLIQWVPEALSSWVKRPERESDQSPPSSAELNNCGGIHLLPHTSSWRGD